MTAEIVALDGPNPWAGPFPETGKEHSCYWCVPDYYYPPMPQRQTLCARCSQLIQIGTIDPMNDSMFVCPKCDKELSE